MTDALQGLGIVVTRPAHQAESLCEMIRAEGGRPIVYPTLEIVARELDQAASEALSDLAACRAIVFVSANAVEFGLPLLDLSILQGLEIIAVGEKTAQRLTDAGLQQVIYPTEGSGSEALLELPNLSEENIRGQRILIIRGNGGRELIADALRLRGARIEYIEVYQRICPPPLSNLADEWNRQALHSIICTSVEGVQNLQSMVGEASQSSLQATPLIVPSARVESRAQELGFKNVLVAANASDETILQTLLNWAEQQSNNTAVRNATMNDEKKLDDVQAEETGHEDSQVEDAQLEDSQVEEAQFEEVPVEETSDEVLSIDAPEEQPAKQAGTGKAALIPWIVCVVLILVLAGFGYSFKQSYNADRQADTEKLAASAASLAASEKAVAGMQQSVLALSAKLDVLGAADQKVNAELSATTTLLKTLEDMVSANSRRQANTSSDWIIHEADYLLSVAANKLRMERDVKTALSAVQAADDRLKSLNEPGIIPIRQQLMSEINDLRGVQQVDINGLALYLADLVERVESLPLKKGIVASAEANEEAGQEAVAFSLENWRAVLNDIWGELKTLVVIRKQAVPDAMLFDPDRHYFLYQNLRLELASARLAVLRTDTANMRASLKLVLGWLNEFFNTSAAPVVSILEALEKMQKVDLAPPLPDISDSRGAIASYMEQQGAR